MTAVAPTTPLNIHQDTHNPYISYGSKRYAVKFHKLSGSNSEEITGVRDWTGVTRLLLDYLQNEVNGPFDFNQMKKVDFVFRGNVALTPTDHFPQPQPVVVRSIRWSQTAAQPTEEVPLPAEQPEGLEKLRRLAVDLATYRSLGPATTQPRPPIQRPPVPQSGTSLIHDAGGGGDCGPNSIAHQLFLMPGSTPKTPQQLRNEVAHYFNSDSVINDPRLCDYVLQSLEEERADNLRIHLPTLADATTTSGEQAARDLDSFRHAAAYGLSQQESNACLRRILNYRKERLQMGGVWVDKDFFYILGRLNTPIGIIRSHGNQHIIEERFPPDRPIDRDKTAWIYYNGTRTNGGYHFQSFHRNRVDFNTWLEQLLLEDRNRAIAHLCEQLEARRLRYNYGDAQMRGDALAAIRLNIIDFRNQQPDLFARMLDLMRQHNPALPFDRGTFADRNDHYAELLDNHYTNILNAQNLMNL